MKRSNGSWRHDMKRNGIGSKETEEKGRKAQRTGLCVEKYGILPPNPTKELFYHDTPVFEEV
ncbi:hypothetical protein FH972_002316 [Carpinus fangiana]|uniref:Uncharacterized protein n=1 Tax=Carpinus fangiana TaxID=176857 RepID=A0A5N6QGC9_9ROSI|nr:hypothetical protein FH972_002316 [Carpinus fangiana]